MDSKPPIRIALLRVPDYLKFSFYGIQEYFEYANQVVGYQRFLVDECAVNDKPPTTEAYDCIIVPPIKNGLQPASLPKSIKRWIHDSYQMGVTICSACAGSLFLAQTGILDDLEATTHWKLAPVFHKNFPKVRLNCEKLIVVQGNVITAGGLTAWADLCVFLTARFETYHTAQQMSRLFLVDTGSREQRYYAMFSPPTQHGDDPVLKCQRWLDRKLEHPLPIEKLAKICGLSVRTLQRRFKTATGYSITEYIQQSRVQLARDLLVESHLPIEHIVWKVGYEDAPTFGKLFKRTVGLSPSSYRKRFRMALNTASEVEAQTN